MRIIAIVQARMGSTRLPGKVLMDIAGRPMIHHVLDRAGRIDGVEEVVAALPDEAEDDELAEQVDRLGAAVVRGPADDVLARFRLAMDSHPSDGVVRITADCPLLSPAVSSLVVRSFVESGVDYASNTLQRTYPRGLDTEVIGADALRSAASEASDPAEREHVTPFIWRRPQRFSLHSVTGEQDLSSLRWTVDTVEDLEFVRAVYGELGTGPAGLDDVLSLLGRRPDLTSLNAHVPQKPVQ